MAEAVAGLLVSAFVSIAKDKLGSAIAEQANLLWNFGGDLEDMKDVLETISAALQDAERRSIKEELVQLLLKRLKHVALDISDVLEDYRDTSDQATAKNPGVLMCIPAAYKKIAIANRMKSLRKELMKINMEFSMFGFISTQGTSTTIVQHYDKSETAAHFLPEVEGREGEKQEIINLLLHARSNHDESETVIVPIYALGGMGKTTLAQQVYNDDQFKKQYDYHIWVYVSQDFNLLKIGNSIISQVPAQGAQQNRDLQNGGLQVIMDCLDNLLCNKKVLIVLDDLWEKDETELNKLKSMLHVGKKGSMIDVIVTTREEGVAREVSTSKLYKLQPLKDDVCWGIIKRSSKCNRKEFERIGLDIAKKCGGVPLAAQALGYMLKSKDISEWKNINDSDIWNEKLDSTVLPSLKLSYQRMPPQLRKCFSYCAIFSKGHNIVEDDLIHQWSVLGFIETSKGKEYIKHLMGMSFLQVSEMTLTSQKHEIFQKTEVQYTMHDLVHDLASLTMAYQLKIYDVAPPRKTSADKYFRYSLLKKYDSSTKLENMPSNMRALHFISDSVQLDIRSGAFSFAKCLRILDFSECSGVLLPDSIGKLKQLRCLVTPRMQNGRLPKFITELSKLQYLNLNQSHQLSALPVSVSKLGCLEYLCLSGCSGISELPESFGDLKSMVHLDMSGCSGITTVPESITELFKLQYLNINGSSKITELPESIGNLGCLKYLCLSGCSDISKLPESLGGLKCMVHLDMSGCARIREIPESLGDLKCMEHLDMSGCEGLRELPDSLGNLTNLLHLELSGCYYVKAIPESLCGLTQLQYLNLSFCRCLHQLPEDIGSLVGLKYLNMSYCHRINKLPESLKELQNLLHLDLSWCRIDEPGLFTDGQSQAVSAIFRNLASINYLSLSHCGMHQVDFIGTLANLEHLDLSGNYSLLCLPDSIGNLKRLHTLDLSDCLELKSLPESIGTLGLKSLVLDGCSNALIEQASSVVNYLLTLPAFKVRADDVNGCSNLHLLEGVHNVTELRIGCLENVRSLEEATKVKLSDKHNLLELTLAWSSTKRAVQTFKDKELLEHLLPPPCLKGMCLRGYSSTRFPGWLMCIDRHLTNLVSIELSNLPTCTNLPPLGQLPHLEKVELWKLPAIKRIDREFCGGKKGAFRRLSSFFIKFMVGLEEWTTTYSVEDDVEEFMFPVLDKLGIIECPLLRLKPCPPTFRDCRISDSNQVICSLEELYSTSQHCTSSSQAIKFDLRAFGDFWKSMRLFHHFPALRELGISGDQKSLPESMRNLTSLESLTLDLCISISALPEWLGDLSSLKSLVIHSCVSIRSLPACIQKLTKLQKLEISDSPQLKEWCESEENKMQLAHIDVRFLRGWEAQQVKRHQWRPPSADLRSRKPVLMGYPLPAHAKYISRSIPSSFFS